jgi:signal transduction histidine kinase
VSKKSSWWKVPGLAWVLGSTALVLMAANVVFLYVDRNAVLPEISDGWSFRSVFDIVVNAGVPIIGVVIASRRPQNQIGWLLLGAGLALGLAGFSRAYALHALVADPGSLPVGRIFGWIPNAIWPIPVGLLPFLFLLFPDGQLTSPKWRPARWFARVVLALILSTTIVFATSLWNAPFELADRARSFTSFALTLFVVVLIALPVAIFLSFASLVVRYRRSVGDERLQLKWFVSAALVVAVTFTATIITNRPVASAVFDVALLLLYAAIGMAILKHRLYDIDVILNKALVYGLLAGFITVVYVAVVVVIGTVVGATYLLALVATAIVAIAFQPARERAKRTANRLVYGERATPYEVLSGFSEHVGETYGGEDILPRMARLVAEGTGATDATVWLRVGPEWRPAASWPVPPEPRSPVATQGDRLPAFPDVDAAIPVRHGNDLLGALTVTQPPKEPLRPEEEKLLSDLAAQAGLVMQNFRLIEDLRSSRQRLVAAHDEERRRLERNLHDGAQQQLVALAVKVRMADRLVGTDAEQQHEALEDILNDAQSALENLRDLARGIYPPLLADRGLPEAIAVQAGKAPIPVTVDAEGVGRYSPEIEAAVYFSVLEAMQNVGKYANASEAVVSLRIQEGDLAFSVSDDGAGFRTETTPYGMGLQNMADRLAAIGGALDVSSHPGRGTRVSGRIPAITQPAAELP